MILLIHYFLYLVELYLSISLNYIKLPFRITIMAEIRLSKIPSNIEEFTQIRNEIANSPEGGAASFVMAMLVFEKDRKMGVDAMTIVLDRTNLVESMNGYKGFSPGQSIKYHLGRFDSKPFWGRTYILGTSPETAYLLPTELLVETNRNSASEQANGDVKIFVKCTGADSHRPITLRANDKGIWKAVECSSMFLDMRAPKQIISDDL
jgi:hypothetical protein